MRFGVREICNVTFRPLAALDIGSQHFDKNQPCLYIDTATASNMEVATTTVYAQGGRGNARLIAWEGEKTATFTVTDALLSPISFSMLSGAGVIDGAPSEKIVHITVDGEIKAGTGTGNASILVKKEAFAGYTPVAPATTNSDLPEHGLGLNVYAMVLDNNGQVVDYLGDQEISQPATRPEAGQNWTIPLQGSLKDLDRTKDGDQTYAGYLCRVDCYAVTTAKVTTLTVDAENFGGTFYIEAETLFRDEATGHDFPRHLLFQRVRFLVTLHLIWLLVVILVHLILLLTVL